MIDLRTEYWDKQTAFDVQDGHEGTGNLGKRCRPGRKLAAEKRRIAKEVLHEFYASPQFLELPRRIQLALLTICIPKNSKNIGHRGKDS